MTHEDAGHFGAKHPGGKIDAAIADEINRKENEGRITCAAAHEIARKQSCATNLVGKNIDLLEKRINKCQMGLFGYGDKKGVSHSKGHARWPDRLRSGLECGRPAEPCQNRGGLRL